MTDQAKCAGVGCPIRDGCDRFVRPAVDGQRWMQSVAFWFDFDRDRGTLLVCAQDPKSVDGRFVCWDHIPLPVQPHGGAREEGDGS